ncbi:hypothetical protein [Thiohalocapsa marina]|uniref:hypothetical protein n=1 Tax=Thiohalocapsa marina TaxID=424902 RepID=UPI0036DD7E3F
MHTPQTDTWALPLLKAKLLNGHHVTQADMLAETQSQAWRLAAAIYYLSARCQWNIRRHDRDGIRVYHLDHAEIQRLRAEQREDAR